MKFKHIVMALAAIIFTAASVSAQTAEEILEKMSAEMERGEAEGFSMDFIMKMPILGSISTHNQIRGEKIKSEIKSSEGDSIVWSDETTDWTYSPKTNEITIENRKTDGTKDNNSDMSQFESISHGYDVSIQKQTPEAWYIVCKKNKDNKEKDDPKRMDLAVRKADFLPIYLRASVSVVTISIENYSLGVSEESITFRAEDYPSAKIVDKRQD